VATSLFLFFFLYLGTIALIVLLMVLCIEWSSVLGWVCAGILLLPVVILVKNLLHRETVRKGSEIEVDLDDHPKLRRFLECLCDETGAPMPDRVLVNWEVNAAAGTDVSVFSLLFGPSRTLVLGLGLINFINTSELKALLAHEFGHLTQYNMKSAPYTRLGMRVIANILCGTRVLGLHRLMQGFFILVVKLHRGLMREMEFHADLVAVSVAGSDAMTNLLYKCLWAQLCLNRALHDLDAARDHELYSNDVFVQQRGAAAFLREQHKDPTLGDPPPLHQDRKSTYQLFRRNRNQDEVAAMWADHPSNSDREINAKLRYVRCRITDDSAWTLFRDAGELRRTVSRQLYKDVFRIKKRNVHWTSSQVVQDFLEEEHAEISFDTERYGLLYNHRNLQSINLRSLRDRIEQAAEAPGPLLRSHASMYSARVKEFAMVHQRHLEEWNMLRAIDNGWYRPAEDKFKMRGRSFHIKKSRELQSDLSREIQADLRWLAGFDVKVFVTYFTLATRLNENWAEELYERYKFHFVIQSMWNVLQPHKSPMRYMFNIMANQKQGVVTSKLYHIIIEVFRRAYEAVHQVLEEAEYISFPRLSNMPADGKLRDFLLKQDLVRKPTHFDTTIEQRWLNGFANQFRDIEKRLNRLHFKSLGNILALQSEIGEAATDKWPVPAVEVEEENGESEGA
jgi:Zn-dependent protease with chaperone function